MGKPLESHDAHNAVVIRVDQDVVIVDFVPLLVTAWFWQIIVLVVNFVAVTTVMLRHDITFLPAMLLQAFNTAFLTHAALTITVFLSWTIGWTTLPIAARIIITIKVAALPTTATGIVTVKMRACKTTHTAEKGG